MKTILKSIKQVDAAKAAQIILSAFIALTFIAMFLKHGFKSFI